MWILSLQPASCRLGFEADPRFCLENLCTPGLAYTGRAALISELPETQEL